MNDIKQSWKRIVAWHKKHIPEEQFHLAPGASAQAIKDVEAELNLRFPNDVKALYRLNDGSGEGPIFPYGYYLLSLKEIVKNWKMWETGVVTGLFDDMPAKPEGLIKKVWWNLNWIPFTHNGGGDHQCVDLDPDVGGTVGQIIKFNHEVGPQRVLASSLGEWLSEFADKLDRGYYRFDPHELSLIPISV